MTSKDVPVFKRKTNYWKAQLIRTRITQAHLPRGSEAEHNVLRPAVSGKQKAGARLLAGTPFGMKQ